MALAPAGGMALAPAPAPAGGMALVPAGGMAHVPVGEVMKLCLLILVIVVLIILILRDAVKALKRKAHWIPGDFLVLSAFTIQLLNLLGSQAEPLVLNTEDTISWGEFWMTHTSRVMLCVIVAYLMPGMANPRAEESWGKLIALALTVFLHVSSEYYIVRRHKNDESYYCSVSGCVHKQQIDMSLYIVFASLISLCFVMLLLLLGCANVAGRSIERILTQKIPRLVLKEPEDLYSELGGRGSEERDYKYHTCRQTGDDARFRAAAVVKAENEERRLHCERCWLKVEDAVLRTWIVARAYSLEYIIARSALVSSAATIVTVQIVITIVGGLRINPKPEIDTVSGALKFTAILLQCGFIFIGWSMIEWRWITAVAYYKSWHKEPRKATAQASWRRELRIEDFWTRHLRELVQAQKPRLRQAELLHYKIKKTIAKEQTSFTVPRHLLYPVIGLQWVTVAFSKACWLTSLMIFHNRFTEKLLFFILAKHDMYALQDYSKYQKMLEDLHMLRRVPETLWVANRKAIAKAKMLILQGNQDGEYMCETLIDFLSCKRNVDCRELSCLEPHKPQTGLKFLCKKRAAIQSQQETTDLENQQATDVGNQQATDEGNEELAVEEHFKEAGEKSWKMTAVSLLTIIIHLAPFYAKYDNKPCSIANEQDCPPKPVKDCMEAYSEAWEIVDFVEETDTESNLNIMNEAADRYFDILQRKTLPHVAKEDMRAVLEDLKRKCVSKSESQCVLARLEELKRECLSKTEPPGSVNMVCALGVKQNKVKDGDGVQYYNERWMKVGGNDSVDWEAAAYGNAVYKLCNSIQIDDEAAVAELLTELENCLADIIYQCLEKIQYLVLFNSKKWAQIADDQRMGKALYVAGKARVIMKKLDMKGHTPIRRGDNLAIVQM